MRKNRSSPQRIPSAVGQFLLLGSLAFAIPAAVAKEAPTALEMARQLNEAFIQAAEDASAAVAVIEIAQKPGYHDWDGENPLLEMLPPELRRQLDQELERRKRSERTTPREPRFDGRGSGVVIRKDGYILTNSHVVDGAEKIKVRFKNGKEYPAVVRGVDPQSDIAVIKIEAQDLPVARFADSSKTRVGEFAIAIGAPFDLDYSVTFGHVSAKGRSRVVPSWGENSPGSMMDQDFIQTDASINPGNSGGPLINIDGEIVGINTLIQGLHTGIGFAIPSNLAKAVAEQLITEGKFTRAWIGVAVEPFKTSELRRLVEGVEDGLVVATILTNGPAIKSALQPSDIITRVNGTPVASAQQLRSAVREKKAGSEIVLEVLRPEAGKKVQKMKITVRSEAWPEAPTALARNARTERDAVSPSLGLTVQTLTPELAARLGLERTVGVIVTAVKADSPAERKRIKEGDIITKVDRKPVSSAGQFRETLQGLDVSEGVIIHLISEGTPRFEILKDGGD